MKKYIFYNAFVLVFLVYYLVTSGFIDKVFVKENSQVNPTIQSGTGSKEFINFIYNMDYFGRWGNYNPNYTKSVENQIYRYNNELHFTGLHVYSGANAMNDGASPGGGYYDATSGYAPYFDYLITLVNNNNLKGFYGRAKFELLSYAQRVEYEVKESSNSSRINYGFCYDSIMSNTYTTDSGRTVLHAQVGVNQPGYLCKNIFENHQHSDLFSWQHNDSIEWRIRPMFRIDSNYVDNFPDSPVVRIDIIKFNGNLKKSVVIKAKDFARYYNTSTLEYMYKGNYIDSINFFYEAEDPKPNLMFIGGKDTSGLNDGWYWDAKQWDNLNNVDFRVYWYGNTDVWFDKLTVEDKWAERLFSGSEDYIIESEVNAFKNKGIFAYFVDELTYSNLLCTKYVKDKIKQIDGNVKFISAISNYINWTNLRNDTIYFKALAEILQPEYLSMDAHEVTDKVPQVFNNAPHISKWNSNNYNEYNDFVQYKLLGDRSSVTSQGNWNENNYSMPRPTGSLVYQVCLAKRYADMCYPKCYLFAQPQIF